MRMFFWVLCLAVPAFLMAPHAAPAQDAFNIGDPLPLPPPPLDDSPTPSAATPLTPPPAPPAPIPIPIPSTPAPAPVLRPPAPTPPAPSVPSLRPPAAIGDASPEAPPLALPPAPLDNVTTVALPPAPDAEVAAAAPAATPDAVERPRPGKIAGGRVNVRAGPNTQYESVAVLGTGSPLTVLSRHGEWYKIAYPPDQLASIHRNYVTAQIEGEIPEEGVRGTVNQNNVDVHAFYWDKSTVVGQLQQGDAVVVRQERGQWFRIDAPATARAYVFAEYVRVEGGGEVPLDSAPPPENPSIDLAAGKQDAAGRLKLSENDRKAAELKEAYFRRLQEQEKREEEQEAQQVNELTQAIDSLESRLKAVDEETSGMLSYPVQTTTIGSAAWAPPDPLYGGFTGWVENIARVGGAPSGFRLSKGGEVRFYLRSDRFDLSEFVGRRVWVNGNIELAAGAPANVLNVAELRALTEAEIAEGVIQPPQTQTPAPAGEPVMIQTPQPMIQTPQPAVDAATATMYGGTGGYVSEPYSAPQATDPYAVLYGTLPGATGQSGGVQTVTTDPFGPQTVVQPYETQLYAPQQTYAPQPFSGPEADPSALPDHVGSTYPESGAPAPMSAPSLGAAYIPYPGEVEGDSYEQPFISEVGP